MHHYEQAALPGTTDRQEPEFSNRVLGVRNGSGQRIPEYRGSLFEGNSMLFKITPRLG
jgi:hypothetical protein